MTPYTAIETDIELELEGETMEYKAWFDFNYEAGYPTVNHGVPDLRYEGVAPDVEITKLQIQVGDNDYAVLPFIPKEVTDALIETAYQYVADMSLVNEA